MLKSAVIPLLQDLSSLVTAYSSSAWLSSDPQTWSGRDGHCEVPGLVTDVQLVNQPHWGRHQNSPSSPITHLVHPGPWAKSIPQMGLSLPEAGITQTAFPSTFLMCAAGTLSLSTLHKSFDWAGNQKSPLLTFHRTIHAPSEGQILLNLCTACP